LCFFFVVWEAFQKLDYLFHRICFHFFLVISTSYQRKKKKNLEQVLMLDTTLGRGLSQNHTYIQFRMGLILTKPEASQALPFTKFP
jgi:hypothetical protein